MLPTNGPRHCRAWLLGCALALIAGAAGAADLPPWILDTYDVGGGFSAGGLHGKNGWVRGQKDARVVAYGGSRTVGDPGRGQVVLLNPNPGSGATVNLRKIVPLQTAGFQVLEFDVMVTGAADPSLAKLEVQTSPSGGWNKKFQLYFGTSMRVNYRRTGASATLVGATVPGRWYHLRCQMDLGSGSLDVYVDGALAAAAIPMHPGPIASLSVSGWEFRPGRVYLDNLVGFRQLARATPPLRGSTARGLVPINVEASAATVRVELYVDWALVGTRSGPFDFVWDSRTNPLPAPPVTPFAFGYWRTQWKGVDAWAEAVDPPQSYTNIYYAASRIDYETSSGAPGWRAVQGQKMRQAAAAGKAIYLSLEVPYVCTLNASSRVTWCPAVEDVLDIAQTVWPNVVAIDLADEPRWNTAETNAVVSRLEAGLRARGLMGATRPLPFGVVYPHGAFPSVAALRSRAIDLAGVEAYLDPPSSPGAGGAGPYEFSPLPQVNVGRLFAVIQGERDRAVAAGKGVVLIMQAYSRNFGWPRIELVGDLQAATYLWAVGDPAVAAVTMFSYLRSSGTKDYGDALKTTHRLIGERALGLPAVPARGNGPRTLALRAVDGAGNSSWDVIRLRVAN